MFTHVKVASKLSEYENIHLEVKYYWFYRTEKLLHYAMRWYFRS